MKGPEDWSRLEPLQPDVGVLGEHLRALELIADGLGGDVPFLMTVFTPLSIASRLASSDDAFVRDLREHGDKVETALEVVTETFTGFAAACLERGASGLFYATTSWATTDVLTSEEYKRFGRTYDLRLLEALPDVPFNVQHVCGDNNMLAGLADYPVHAFNWDVRGAGNPSLVEGRALVGGRAVIGGIDHKAGLVDAAPGELAAEVSGLRLAMGDRGWMLGTGCTFPPETSDANVSAVRRVGEAT